jgi:hypothetical protein
MTILQTTPLQQLTERIADWRSAEIEVDRSQRIVRNIALTGCKSRNGYEYTPEALRGAIALYEHKPVFLDHAARSTRPFERSTRDLVGSIVEPRFEQGRIRGNIKVLDTEAGRTFLALTEADEIPVGMSHVVLARRSADRKQVESIEEVVSVDAVIYPATTAGFRENYEGTDPEPVLVSEEIRQLRSECDSLREQLSAVETERDRLQEQMQRSSARQKMLAESGLPEFAISDEFREQILQAETDEACRKLIRDRLAVIQESRQRTPFSRSRRSENQRDPSDQLIVSLIRAGRISPQGRLVTH